MIHEQISVTVVTAILLFAAWYQLSTKTVDPKNLRKSLPWIGVKDGIVPTLRKRFASMTNMMELMGDGYSKTYGHSFIVPGFFDPPQVVVPCSEIKWIVDQPEDVLSASAMQRDMLEADRTFLDSSIVEYPVHEKRIRKELTRSLGALIPEILDEVSHTIDDTWGIDTEEWKDIVVFANMMDLISKASNRILVGLPLCRNEHYLKNAQGFAQDIPVQKE